MNSSPNTSRDFQITETPTLHFVSTEDEQRLSQDLQARLEESLKQAEAQPEVSTAMETHRIAADRLQQLKNAERALHQCARELNEQMAASGQKTLDAIIESAADGKPEFTNIGELTVLETRGRQVGRALERIVEHMIPLGQIAELREDSQALATRARAIEKVAQERAERVLGQLRDAVSEEIVLPVDMSKGVAGALLAHATGLKKLAIQQSENADRMEKAYTARAAEKRG